MRFVVSILILFILFSINSNESYAQDSYVPPPMFGGARVVEDDPAYKNSKTPDIKQEAPLSQPAPTTQPQKKNKLVIPRAEKIDTIIEKAPVRTKPIKQKPVIKTVKPKKLAPKPSSIKPNPKPKKEVVIPKKLERVEPLTEVIQKVQPEIPSTQTIITPSTIEVLEPEVVKEIEVEKIKLSSPPKKLEPIDLIQKVKPTSQGIVKGPKTMPAIKKKDVEAEVLYAPKTKEPANLIDRAQEKEIIEEKSKVKKVEPSPDYTLPKFKILADGSRKLHMVFEPNDKTANDNHRYAIQEMILPRLKENKELRLRLESYASKQNNSLSGDRRISLSRVMALRKFLLDNAIEANRLDIRSLGAQTNTHPMDRVEIHILKP